MGETGGPPLQAGWVLLEGWGQLGHYRAHDPSLLFVCQVARLRVVRQCWEYPELTCLSYADSASDIGEVYYVAMTLSETCATLGLGTVPAEPGP